MPYARTKPWVPRPSARRLIIHAGEYKSFPKRISLWERRLEWALVCFDEDPWPLDGTPCSSNVRVVRTEFTRKKGALRPSGNPVSVEVIPSADHNDLDRMDLRMTLPTFDRQYLHVIVYWLLHGKHLKTYA